jgi:hypothetical protein
MAYDSSFNKSINGKKKQESSNEQESHLSNASVGFDLLHSLLGSLSSLIKAPLHIPTNASTSPTSKNHVDKENEVFDCWGRGGDTATLASFDHDFNMANSGTTVCAALSMSMMSTLHRAMITCGRVAATTRGYDSNIIDVSSPLPTTACPLKSNLPVEFIPLPEDIKL